jgi:hypothetical protein
MKSETRVIAEGIKSKTGLSLVSINHNAQVRIEMGLASDRLDALKQILEMVEA